MKDHGSFTIPCNIGESYYDKALCDLRVSINLTPKFIFKMLGIGEVKLTIVIVQLANRSLAYPEGKMEAVLVRVDKFIFPVDFLVLDFEADKEVQIVMARHFLATGITLIDVKKGELTMRVQDDQNNFVEYPLENTLGFEPLEDEEGNESMALMKANLRDYVQLARFESLKLEAWEYTQPKLSIEEPPKLKLNIILEVGERARIDGQRTLNPIIKEVVQKEVIKWLYAGIIYPISNSSWVGPVVTS
ncbi:Retrovirus-related Pol polyprotein from transposon opus [Gossypium australe]|uniref:Retrovirus-related Pol polyprotein from transposon opus n=1 Tax=Gossypium australe TaxID=47621 RepID=A0A5B6WI01_9ROSI|nr:Retrovirus-related Pol polyprotein from transposon opus [Gossypium australe]